MQEVTKPMYDYAKDIAYNLNLKEPNYNNYLDVHDFLREYAPIFKEFIKNNERVKHPVDRRFSKKLVRFIENNAITKGVYLLWDYKGNIAYIGRAGSTKHRIISSIKKRRKQADLLYVSYIETETMADCFILEPLLIIENNPYLNSEFKCDDCSYIWRSKININELPKIVIWEHDNV